MFEELKSGFAGKPEPAPARGTVPVNCAKPSSEDITGLEDSVQQLHTAVNHLIWIIQENAAFLPGGRDILDKLPLLDFYNHDLLQQLESLQLNQLVD
jgi:hypothetical protein